MPIDIASGQDVSTRVSEDDTVGIHVGDGTLATLDLDALERFARGLLDRVALARDGSASPYGQFAPVWWGDRYECEWDDWGAVTLDEGGELYMLDAPEETWLPLRIGRTVIHCELRGGQISVPIGAATAALAEDARLRAEETAALAEEERATEERAAQEAERAGPTIWDHIEDQGD